MESRSLSKLFEETVLRQTFQDDPYLRRKVENQIRPSKDPHTFGHGHENSKHLNAYYRYYDGEFEEQNRGSIITQNNATNFDVSDDENEPRDSSWDHCDWGWGFPKNKPLIFKFFEKSSMHGLKFIAQPRRHLTERIFWTVAFLLAIVAAGYLISSVWTRYNTAPVVVVFDSTEMHIDSIPFPAVTICNMNKISVDTINRLNHRARRDDDGPLARYGRDGLRYARSLCNNFHSFAKIHGFAHKRGRVTMIDGSSDSANQTRVRRNQTNPTNDQIFGFILKEAPPCEEMIIKCIWAEKVTDCRKLFRIAFSDYGKCCTFNRLPIPLMYSAKLFPSNSNATNASITTTAPVSRSSSSNSQSKDKDPRLTKSSTPGGWSVEDLVKWGKWNYRKGFTVDNKKSEYPRRQGRAGAAYGLSLLLDPSVDRYFCPVTDSEGFRVAMSNPLEESYEDVTNLGVAVGLNQEVSINIQPHLTIADADIHKIDFNKRLCMFDDEVELDFYRPYARKNCIFECTASIVLKNCSCVPYNMPKTPTTTVCSLGRRHRECIRKTRKMINKNIHHFCGECHSLCSELTYTHHVSTAKLQESKKLWFDHSDRLTRPPDWSGHKMSVVHIYFGKDEFVPHLRREVYGLRDLIANTGNVLSLCLGFSILSAVEIIFFCTVRPCWSYFRRRREKTDSNQNHSPSGSPNSPRVRGQKNEIQNGNNKILDPNRNRTRLKVLRNQSLIRRRSNDSQVIHVSSVSMLQAEREHKEDENRLKGRHFSFNHDHNNATIKRKHY